MKYIPARLIRAVVQDIPGLMPELTPLAERQRGLIITAGINTFAHLGRKGVAMRSFAKSVCMTRSQIEVHFIDLDVLLAEILRTHILAISRAMGSAPDNPKDRRAAYFAYTRGPFGNVTMEHALFIFERKHLPPDLLPGIERIHRHLGPILCPNNPDFAIELLATPGLTLEETEHRLANPNVAYPPPNLDFATATDEELDRYFPEPDPMEAAPFGADLSEAEPLGAEPREAKPREAGPLGAAPPKAGHLEANSRQRGPLTAGSLGAAPLRAEPLRAEPLRAEPLGAEPLRAGPLGTQPLGTEPLGTEPLRAGLLATQPLGTGPLETEPLDADPPETQTPTHTGSGTGPHNQPPPRPAAPIHHFTPAVTPLRPRPPKPLRPMEALLTRASQPQAPFPIFHRAAAAPSTA